MTRFKKYVWMTGVVVLISLVQPLKGTAQISDPGCDPADPACPIDGGLSLLIAAGIGIGAKKAYDKKKKTAEM